MTATIELPPETEPWQMRHHVPIPPYPVRHWVAQCAALCRPDRVYWCAGADQELTMLRALAANEDSQSDGPALTWEAPSAGPTFGPNVRERFQACMKGRTMFVVPTMINASTPGHYDVTVQVTDSPQMVLDLANRTQIGDPLWNQVLKNQRFGRRLHSTGATRSAR